MDIKPLQKIEITEGNTTYKNGSKGIMIYRSHLSYYNVWEYNILFTRIGKKGKPRLMPASIRIRHKNPTSLSDEYKPLIDDVKILEGLEPRPPIFKVSKREKISDLEMDVVPTKVKYNNLMNLSGWSLVQYITAFSLFLEQAYLSNLRFFRGNPRALLKHSVSLDDIDLISEKSAIIIGTFIIDILNNYEKDQVGMDKLFSNLEYHKELILFKLIKQKSIFANVISKYMKTDKKLDELMDKRVFCIIDMYKSDEKQRIEDLRSVNKLNRYSPICPNELKDYIGNELNRSFTNVVGSRTGRIRSRRQPVKAIDFNAPILQWQD